MLQLSSLRRLIYSAALALFLATLMPVVVAAKMPYFTIDIAPGEQRPGEPVVITVRTWEDSAHTIPARFSGPDVSGLLVIRSTSQPSADIPVSLHMREPGWFDATVSLPAGDWMVVAFPDRSGWASPALSAGYPDSIALAVREPAVSEMALLISAALTLAVLAVAILVRRGMRMPPAQHSGRPVDEAAPAGR